MNLSPWKTCALVGLLVFSSTACRDTVAKQERRIGTESGLPVLVTAFDFGEQRFEDALVEAKLAADRIEGLVSPKVKNSDLARAMEGGTAVVSPETLQVMEKVQELCTSTEGAFDVTIGPVLDLWLSTGPKGQIPEAVLKDAMDKVGCQLVKTSRTKSLVSLEKAGMRLELGGIIRGIVGEEVKKVLQKYGITRGIVDLDGDILLFSGKGDPEFKVGINHPLKPGTHYAVLSIAEGAVMTTACYGNATEAGCNIVDPRSGKVSTSLLSVTVTARDAAAADAYSTAFFVLGADEGFALAKSLPEVEAVFLMSDGAGGVTMKATPGLKDRVTLAQ